MSAESIAVLRFASPGLRRATRIALLAVVPSLIALGLAGHFIDRGTSGADFKGGVIAGSTRIVDGKQPYLSIGNHAALGPDRSDAVRDVTPQLMLVRRQAAVLFRCRTFGWR